ncbi:A disintegrin and metalloproteinase with thrombospondin motifs like isoform X1 [Diorhabda carinulata]|uniref:A disintegrin and metalloproteinase with thrombospondin motifs like isoform X1 n=3 Tax=Diorhabda carinulata TaxID=1163345 RepID=UPI0025A06CCF|nr:A disintegrin and metalloproteinase with thrombospondin motifs like isoform X1 [Diorhabda carinulata]
MTQHMIILLLSCLLCTCSSFQIHKQMSLEEIKRTFHVDNHDLVPEYEVVPIQNNESCSLDAEENLIEDDELDSMTSKIKIKSVDNGTTKMKLRAFGKPFNLSLVPTRGLFKKGKLKLWTIEPNATAQHGVEYVEIPETDDNIGELYQDEENEAAILLRSEEDGIVVEGSIGSHLVIRPLPARLRGSVIRLKNNFSKENDTDDLINDDEMFLDQDGELSSEIAIDTGLPIKRNKNIHHHIIYKKTQEEQENSMSDYAFMEPDRLTKRYKRSTNRNRSKREAPYTIYPEILVIVDYDGYRLHGGDNLQIKRYFVSFWNGVDLRYKLLKGPKIRISIAGIIISRGRDATPYLERNRVGRDAIDSAAALTDMGKYLFRERRLPVYDVAVAITKLDMCRKSYPSDVCNRGTAGFAYVGGACVVNKRLEKVNSVAIIEDTGGFSGIIVAAHEVGHLLGAVHDGSPPPSYLGGPGAEKCQWTDGFIMSDLRHTERGFRWSSCSVASFHHFLNGDTATCLYNAPHEDESLPRVLPGKLLTLDAQCRRDRGTSACFKDDRVCAQLFCFDSGSGYCVAYRPAAEGSPCGDGQYCLNGKCVAEHENIIPDYSQNTPSYVRSNSRPLYQESQEHQEVHSEKRHKSSVQKPHENYEKQSELYTRKKSVNHNQYQNIHTQTQYKSPYNVRKVHSTGVPSEYNTTSSNFFSNYPQFSTSKSPYNFDLYTKSTSQSPSPFTTIGTTNHFIGNYYLLRKQTTKNPYDFANFGKSTKNPYETNNYNENTNNYLKRSYSDVNYFSDNNTESLSSHA